MWANDVKSIVTLTAGVDGSVSAVAVFAISEPEEETFNSDPDHRPAAATSDKKPSPGSDCGRLLDRHRLPKLGRRGAAGQYQIGGRWLKEQCESGTQ